MKRRNFVKNLAIASAGTPILLNEMKFQSISKKLFDVASFAEDRVLVIIRLNGGNDGINTVIPRDQYANLTLQRSNILIPETSVLPLTTEVGLHPVMTGMRNMYQDGKLGIIQNVGYPEQNRSHFRSMDIWSSGLIDNPPSTGWLGRQMDVDYPNYPDAYPNSNYPDPFAISMGYEVSSTCQGLMANFSHAVNNPFDIYNLATSGSLNDGTYYGSQVEYLKTLIDQANAYGGQINTAANAGNTLSTMYDPNNPLAVQLRYVAQMISGGLKSKVYILNIDGFDTHDSQVIGIDPTTGNHANLIKRLSDAVEAFQNDLMLLGLEQKVAGITFSEFGRQIASNASLGTDHGDAAPLFLFGSCLDVNIMGPNPVIGSSIINQEGIPMQIDFRDIYASVLKDWFGVSTTDIQALFEHTVTFYPVLSACNVGLDEEDLAKEQALIYPNPSTSNATIRFTALSEWVRVDIYDLQSKLMSTVYDGNLSQGRHDIPMEVKDLPAGEYIVQIKKASGVVNTKLLKIK
ncbi:MAG: hypothetical protein A3D92_09705 [Bacteroidetes bacterium RIFCSPHIGHO2_02_FULL_44_7]|nr:MAG: hypothetical protein A3D92_09705 [Bacteroidetes bacterium RIFCSPHIGHO2_02_FULL_44_7]